MGEIHFLLEGSMQVSTLPELRPLRLGELLDQAVRIYRRNFLAFVGIVALVYAPYLISQVIYAVLMSYMQNLQTTTNSMALLSSAAYWVAILTALLSGAFYAVFVLGFGTAAFTDAVSDHYLGRKTGILETYKRCGSYFFQLLGTLILFGLLYVVAILWAIIPCVGWITSFGLLIFIAGVVGPMLPAVAVVEKADGMNAIHRAWDLARRRFWWLIGFAVIFYLFNALVVSGPTALISFVSAFLLGKGGLGIAAQVSAVMGTVAGGLIQLLILPIQLTAWALVYFDLRVRTEGLDLALSTLTLNPPENAAIDLSSLPTSTSQKSWLTGDDVGKFVVITLVIVGLYALLFGLLALVGASLPFFRGFGG